MPSKTSIPKVGAMGAKKMPVDYQVLLLALADEYLDAAHSQGTALATPGHESQLEEYFKLIATALGCLEAVLRLKVGGAQLPNVLGAVTANNLVEVRITPKDRSPCSTAICTNII